MRIRIRGWIETTATAVTVHVSMAYRNRLAAVNKHVLASDGRPEMIITVEDVPKRRSLKSNALMWALYNILAAEANGGKTGSDPEEVTPEALYNEDMMEYAPTAEIDVKPAHVEAMRSLVTVKSTKPGREGAVSMTVLLTSSKWSSVQMADHIDRLFNRLAFLGVGVADTSDIADYWLGWRKQINDEKIDLHGYAMTAEEYKEATPICEATGAFLGSGGELHHISSRGSGVTMEAQKERPANWLHLCAGAHSFYHENGPEAFVKKYPHLKNKVRDALQTGGR